SRLGEHQRRNVATGGLDAYFFPPSCKARGATPKLQQRADALVGRHKLLHNLFLPYLSAFIPSFIPLLVCIGMFAVKKPFGSSLPVLLLLRNQVRSIFFYIHFLCY